VRPLEGLKVLDLSRLLPGPFATLVLADLGAQVDKIEDTEAGDYLRHLVTATPSPGRAPRSDARSDEGMPPGNLFAALNRNKRSACIDLKKPEAREPFLRLVDRYDVLIEQFRPGVMDRLGLGHAVLRARNPRLVVCAVTGYGQTGPLA
jgi:crotonobetainyl-CoA:carnitine CoA-transferase CaiB-like acyl-CoA transferase